MPTWQRYVAYLHLHHWARADGFAWHQLFEALAGPMNGWPVELNAPIADPSKGSIDVEATQALKKKADVAIEKYHTQRNATTAFLSRLENHKPTLSSGAHAAAVPEPEVQPAAVVEQQIEPEQVAQSATEPAPAAAPELTVPEPAVPEPTMPEPVIVLADPDSTSATMAQPPLQAQEPVGDHYSIHAQETPVAAAPAMANVAVPVFSAVSTVYGNTVYGNTIAETAIEAEQPAVQ